MADFLLGAAGVVFGFSSLIFIHEFGHFVLAKWHGVRVHVFSIGMGPYLFSFTLGETVYVLSMIPIGGYVKMAGQDDMRPNLEASRDPRDYRNKKPGQRMAILAAGAAFNLLFALFAFTACYDLGVELPSARAGEVFPNSPLAKAQVLTPQGFQPHPLKKGDLITSINGTPVKSFLEVTLEVAGGGAGKEVWINYERDGEPVLEPVMVRTEHSAGLGAAVIGLNHYFEEQEFRLGFTTERAVYVLQTAPDSPALQAGIRSGDRIVSIDGHAVAKGEELSQQIEEAKGREQTLVVRREGKEVSRQLQAKYNSKAKRWLIGLQMISGCVERVDPRSEAYEQGLRKGDFITMLHKLRSGDRVELAFGALTPNGIQEHKARVPLPTVSGDPSLVYAAKVRQMQLIQTDHFMEALALGWSDVIRHSTAVFSILHGLLTRNVSLNSVSSFIGIGHVMTRVAVQQTFLYYLWFLAFISVNLGVLQFVPIPLLDGWHLLLIGVEKLKGSPVAPRIQEAFQYVGLFIILALLLFATSNDLVRLFSQ